MPQPINQLKNRHAKGLRKVSKNVGAESSFEHYILGNAAGKIRPSKPNDKLWIVRRDEDAPEEYLPWLMLGMFPTVAGTGLIVGYHDGVRGIYSADGQQLIASGQNINKYNTGDTALQGWFSKTGYPGLVCTAIGTKTTPSTIVMIEAHEWVDEEGVLHYFRRAQQDLASAIPGSGLQRLVLVGLLYDDTPFMVQGATRSSGISVLPAHKQALLLAKPPRAIECAIYQLANGQTSVTEADKIWDARELLNTQRPPRHNWGATTDPDVTDDSDSGYGIGSIWVNTSTPESFMCVDDSPGAAVWQALGGGGGGINELTGDVTAGPGSGSQAATLATVNGDVGSFAAADITVNAKGLITAAAAAASTGTGNIVRASSPTMTTPTIADFTNAQHNHTNAAGGGQLTDAALSAAVGIAKGGTGQTTQVAAFDALAPTTTKGDIPVHNGSDNVRLPVGTNGQLLVADSTATEGVAWKSPLAHARYGLKLRVLDSGELIVTAGSYELGGQMVSIEEAVVINLATAANWIGGSSLESASEYVKVYGDASGNLKLSDKYPNYTYPDLSNRKTTGQINEAIWNGTVGGGLDGFSIDVDNLSTALDSSMDGMLVLFYTDSGFTTGRGRESGAGGSVDNLSAALITIADNSLPRITTYTGHNIALNNNDYFLIVPFGPIEYLYDGSAWWRLIGTMYNNASSNLEEEKQGGFDFVNVSNGADITTSSTSYTNMHSTLSLRLLCDGSPVMVNFKATIRSSLSNVGALIISVNGIDEVGDDGFVFTASATNVVAGFERMLYHYLLPGTHTIKLRWKVASGTLTLPAGGSQNSHPQFSAYLVH